MIAKKEYNETEPRKICGVECVRRMDFKDSIRECVFTLLDFVGV